MFDYMARSAGVRSWDSYLLSPVRIHLACPQNVACGGG